METNLQQIISDESTRKKLSAYEAVPMFNDAYALFLMGIDRLEKMTNSLIVDDTIKKEVKTTTLTIINELQRLYNEVSEPIQTFNSEQTRPLTNVVRILSEKQKRIGLDSPTSGTVDEPIIHTFEES